MNSKFKYILPVLLIGLCSTSCKKGWLDVTSDSEIRSDDQFKSEAGFKDALMGVYIGMTSPTLYAKDMTWNMMDILSHQYSPLNASTAYYDVQNHNYKSVAAAPQIDAIWNKSYNVIANINNALNNIDKNKSVLNPKSYAIIKGELLGLRAFLHLDLMRVYGYGNLANRADIASKFAIPYVSNFSKDVTPQLSYANTFALMAKDIDESLSLLKEDPIYNNPKKPDTYYAEINRDGFYNKREQRMNYYAVKALQARMLEWQGGTQNMAAAAVAAEEVIKDASAKLIVSTAASSDPILYKEHLFNLNVVAFANIVDPFLNANDATAVNTVFMPSQFAQEVYETSIVNIGPPDIRFNTLLNSQARGLVSIKLRQLNKPGGRINTVPLMKLPEMYYIAAENYTETNLAKAIEYLNIVRSSRGIVQNIPNNALKEVVKNEIYKEYRKEYISEGQLFFFYKRMGRTTIPGYANPVGDNIYVLPYPANEIEFGNRVQ